MTTEKQLQGCKINLADYEDWIFAYGYESNGKDVIKMVRIVCDDDVKLYLTGKSILVTNDNQKGYQDIDDYDLTTDDFKDCQDIDDCSLVIAKHLIKDNDGVVLTTVVNHRCHTLTGIYYEKKLSKELEYINGDLEDESWSVTLYANQTSTINSYDYLEVNKDDVQKVMEMINCRDNIGLQEYLFENDYDTNEVLNLWGDDSELLSFEIEDFRNNTIDVGKIVLSTNNLFDYNDFEYNQIVTPDHHPDYVLIHQDEIKRSYATFRVPKDFNIGEIHFVDRYIIPKNYMLDWERFGDYMTTIGVFKYRGKLYFADDYGDAGSWGDHHFGLFKWNKEKNRYELLAEM